MDSLNNPRMRSTTADISLQELHDLRVARICIRLQQPHAAHYHSAGAKRALKRPCVEKGLLYGMQLPCSFKPFDGDDRFRRRRTDRDLTRAPRRSAYQHRASTALAFSATILRARQA